MRKNLAVGDVVTYRKEPEGMTHNALIIQCLENGNSHLVHITTYNNQPRPQVELNVPHGKPDDDGRCYVVADD